MAFGFAPAVRVVATAVVLAVAAVAAFARAPSSARFADAEHNIRMNMVGTFLRMASFGECYR